MKIIKINNVTILFLFIAFICGYIKNAIIIFFIVLIHELGHITIIRLYNDKIKRVIIYPFGGITEVEKDLNTSINKELLIAIGGFIFQLLVFLFINIIPFNELTRDLIIEYNKIILIFNLLPIIPLDGSIIINYILNKYLSFTKAYIINIIISILSLTMFIIYNYAYSLNNYLIISFLIYKIYYAIKGYKYIKNRFFLERYLKKYKYNRIINNTNSINDLRLETYHYFNNKGKIVNERRKIQELFDKYRHF